MTEESKKENKEEEIIELFQDQIPVLTYEELIKQENIFRYPTLVGANLVGGKAIFGSGDKIMRFEQDKGLWLGNADFNLAPFRVNMSGDVVANSITINGVTGEQISHVANPTADAVPTGLTCSSTGITTADDGTISAYVVLTWNAISSDTFDHYVVRYKKSSHTYYTQITATTNTITIDGLVPNISYDFGVASVNKYGTVSNFSSDISQTTASDTTPPATVTGVSATAGIQYVILEWTHNTENDLDSYNIYRNTTNDSETATLIGNVKTNYFIDGGREGDQTYYYWIKAVDTSGNVSANFSSEVHATPRNVTSDDVTTIAASKVLIDGTVYLSNWRHSSDFTKIDGGKIYAGSVTTTQLNFTPVTSTNIIASINASEEGIKIEADNITIGGATTFESGYDPTTKTAKVGGTYDSALSGARVRIFPDSNTGIQIIDDSGNDVFKALVGGTNVGDVIIGNYAGGQGIFYDKSENKTTFAGNLSAASGTLGTITAGSLIGLSIKTAASGDRIEIVGGSDAGIKAIGVAELIKFYVDSTTFNASIRLRSGGPVYPSTTIELAFGVGSSCTDFEVILARTGPDTGHFSKVSGNTATLGTSSLKWNGVYYQNLYSCPLPTVDNALELLKTISEPKEKSQLKKPHEASYEYKDGTKKRKYFDVVDMPEELTSLNDVGEPDIEITRVVGFLFKAVKELNQKVEQLELKLKS